MKCKNGDLQKIEDLRVRMEDLQRIEGDYRGWDGRFTKDRRRLKCKNGDLQKIEGDLRVRMEIYKG